MAYIKCKSWDHGIKVMSSALLPLSLIRLTHSKIKRQLAEERAIIILAEESAILRRK